MGGLLGGKWYNLRENGKGTQEGWTFKCYCSSIYPSMYQVLYVLRVFQCSVHEHWVWVINKSGKTLVSGSLGRPLTVLKWVFITFYIVYICTFIDLAGRCLANIKGEILLVSDSRERGYDNFLEAVLSTVKRLLYFKRLSLEYSNKTDLMQLERNTIISRKDSSACVMQLSLSLTLMQALRWNCRPHRQWQHNVEKVWHSHAMSPQSAKWIFHHSYGWQRIKLCANMEEAKLAVELYVRAHQQGLPTTVCLWLSSTWCRTTKENISANSALTGQLKITQLFLQYKVGYLLMYLHICVYI